MDCEWDELEKSLIERVGEKKAKRLIPIIHKAKELEEDLMILLQEGRE